VPSRAPKRLENHSLLNSIGMGNRPVYWEKSLFSLAMVLRVFPLASPLQGEFHASLHRKAVVRKALARAEQDQSRRASDNEPGLLLGDDLPGTRRGQHQHPAISASGRRPLRRDGSLDAFCGSGASEEMEDEGDASFFTCVLSKGCGCLPQE
jgi:hypothetical protein